MRAREWTIATLAAAVLAVPCAAEPTLDVAAAASLSDALREIAALWESGGGERIALNFAGSSTLARQIEQGAPADLFLSADEAQMDRLERAGLLMPGSRRALLGNSLVVVVPTSSTLGWAGAESLAQPGVSRIAMADPSAVPAGVYARLWLRQTGLWERVADRVVPLENVRGALAAVESGNVDAAVVYATDAALCRRCRVALRVQGDAAPQIVYPVAVLAASRQQDAALRFSAYLSSPPARAVFTRLGFPAPR